jgi:hypothetical protein
MVYLDHNATTPLAPEAREAMLPFLADEYGNASSIHSIGRRARAAVDDARDRMAAILGAKPHEMIFTSGGTESCNLGLIGIARAHAVKGKHIIVSAIEHHAVLHAAEHLQHFEGFEVTLLPVDSAGIVDLALLPRLIRKDTTVVSIMHANNETGVIQPLEEIAALCADRGVFFIRMLFRHSEKCPSPAVFPVSRRFRLLVINSMVPKAWDCSICGRVSRSRELDMVDPTRIHADRALRMSLLLLEWLPQPRWLQTVLQTKQLVSPSPRKALGWHPGFVSTCHPQWGRGEIIAQYAQCQFSWS